MTPLKGIPAAPGVAMGKAVFLASEDVPVPRRSITDDQIPYEVLRLEEALIKTCHQILAIQRKLAEELGQGHADILNAHLLVLEDQAARNSICWGVFG